MSDLRARSVGPLRSLRRVEGQPHGRRVLPDVGDLLHQRLGRQGQGDLLVSHRLPQALHLRPQLLQVRPPLAQRCEHNDSEE